MRYVLIKKAAELLGYTPTAIVRITSEEYLKRLEDRPSSIKRARIVPPLLDDDEDYGSFLVESHEPRYEVEL